MIEKNYNSKQEIKYETQKEDHIEVPQKDLNKIYQKLSYGNKNN